MPLLGLTATATVKVKEDIGKQLGISKDILHFQSSYNRPNLYYEIRHKKEITDIEKDVLIMLRTRFKGMTGIIYCNSRKDCEKLSETLKRNCKINCAYYHADLSFERRSEVQKGWMEDEIQVIVATIAFGMGIDKRYVRFVIHYSLPKSLESYA